MTKLIPALAYGLLLSLSLSGKARAGDLPEWLTGEWIQQRADRWAEEVWTLRRGESQLGWEVLRLVRAADGTLTLHVAPEGGEPTMFALVEQGVRDISFANPDHDYPQRIRYWREGRLLMAETSKMDGSETQSWTYAPAGE